jgi:hypothetical protein
MMEQFMLQPYKEKNLRWSSHTPFTAAAYSKETDEKKKGLNHFGHLIIILTYQLNFMWQKLKYIHNNAVKAGLVYKEEEYVCGSAAVYVFRRHLAK